MAPSDPELGQSADDHNEVTSPSDENRHGQASGSDSSASGHRGRVVLPEMQQADLQNLQQVCTSLTAVFVASHAVRFTFGAHRRVIGSVVLRVLQW